jgi:hypothetical protein
MNSTPVEGASYLAGEFTGRISLSGKPACHGISQVGRAATLVVMPKRAATSLGLTRQDAEKLSTLAFPSARDPFDVRRRGVVCSAKWVIDGYTFDLAPMAHILGEQLAAAERASGSYNRCVPIRQPMYRLDLQCVDHDG